MEQRLSIHQPFETADCNNYSPDYYIGFRIISQEKGENYIGKNNSYYNLLFMLEGELEFSYDIFIKQHLHKNEILLIPPRTEAYSNIIESAKVLVLTFNNKVEWVCDNCSLYNYIKHMNKIEYSFHPLTMTPQIRMFTDVMTDYIQTHISCQFLNELKQKELFILLSHNYSSKELCNLLYPMVSNDINFRSNVLKLSQKEQSITELAQNMSMSPRTFSRKFLQEFGEPARHWLLKQKAKNIRLRLLVPGTTIADILLQYKFTDMSHFSKFSKEHYGCTPTELIKRLKKK